MGFEYKGSAPDPNTPEQTYPTHISSGQQDAAPQPHQVPNLPAYELEHYPEPSYREHVSGPLYVTPPAARPPVYPAYPSRPAQPVQRNNPTQNPPTGWQPYPAYSPYPTYTQPQPNAAQGAYRPQGTYPAPPAYSPATPYPQQQTVAPGWAQPYAGQPYPSAQQPGYPYGYPPNYGYYGWRPAAPKRSGYQLTVAIISTVCSGIVFFTGFICVILLLLTSFAPQFSATPTQPEQLFGSITMFTALSIAGVGGGIVGLYHSICALMNRKSSQFKLPSIPLGKIKLPWFVLFLLLYVVMIAIGLLIRGNDQIAANTGLSVTLVELAGLLPALTILSLATWRIHNKTDERWPTTWRRVSIALISGATSAILFALIFETILGAVIQAQLHINSLKLDDPNMPIPNDLRAIIYLFLLVAVVAPLVEEGVKPLAVVALVGRLNGATEAFILGMACGIGFDLVETSGYIGMGYSNWVDIAIQRSSAGLLHSFGAGMSTLGWYYLTHRKSLKQHRILIGLGCGAYAVLQHAFWNGTFIFQLLPDPIGPYLDKGEIMIGTYPLPAVMIIYSIETLLMLTFFLFVLGRLSGKGLWRRRPTQQRPSNMFPPNEPVQQPQPAHR